MPGQIALEGNQAVAEAMRQINPDVVAAYPITPSTEIVQIFSKYVADGLVDTEFVAVESEHSAMSACIAASVAGGRVMNATSSAGMALMWEMLYIAASIRTPIVLALVNRALSGNINIHCDHSDAMGARDAGWLQLFCENAQEAYDTMFQAVKIGEDLDVRLPVMVCLDGFIISHSVEMVAVEEDEKIREWVGPYTPNRPLLDLENPYTVGPLDLQDFYFEHKRSRRREFRGAVRPLLRPAGGLPVRRRRERCRVARLYRRHGQGHGRSDARRRQEGWRTQDPLIPPLPGRSRRGHPPRLQVRRSP